MYRIGLICLACWFLAGPVPAQKNMLCKVDSLMAASDYRTAKTVLEAYVVHHRRPDFQQAKAFDQLSYIHIQLHQLREAEDINERSLAIKKRLYYEYFADNYMRLGTIRLKQKRYDEALDYYLEALDLPHEDLGFTGILYGYLGIACARLGQPQKALEFYQRSQATLTTVSDQPHPDKVSNELQMGKLYLLMEENEQAEAAFDRALALDREVDPAGANPRRVALYNAVGALQFFRYKNDTLALQHYDEAHRISIQRWGNAHPETVRCLANKVDIQRYRKNYDLARENIQAGINTLLPLGPAQSPYRLYEQVRLADQPLLLRLLKQEAGTALDQYRENGEKDALHRAYAASETAATLFEQMLDGIGEASSMEFFMEQYVDVYEEGIQAAYSLGRETNDPVWEEKAFLLSERSKTGILRRMVQQSSRFNGFNLPKDQHDRQRRLLQQIADIDVQLSSDYTNPVLRRQMANTKKEYRSLLNLVAKEKSVYNIVPTPSVVDIQRQLDNETVLLSYYMARELYFIFGISRDHFTAFAFPQDSILPGYDRRQRKKGMSIVWDKNKILEKIGGEVYSELTAELGPVSLKEGVGAHLVAIKKMQGEEFAFHSNRLYGKLIYPIRNMLHNKEHLVIIPHGELYYLPFEALTQTKAGSPIRYAKLDYLIRDYAISYHYSVALYQQSVSGRRDRADLPERFLGIAPVFSDSSTTGYIWNSRDYVLEDSFHRFSEEQGMRYSALDGRQFRALLYSEDEVLGIAELFARHKKESMALFHDEATESAFKLRAQQYKYIHIASHSFANADYPALSGIAFAAPPLYTGEEDGILHAPESYSLDLQADLLVLSSCESGTGKYVPGEGLMSLTRGFLYAGVPNMMCSMWKVYDSYTARLMLQFYDQLLDGKNYSKALRAAKLKMIRKEKTAHPRKWSGFILIGVN